MTPGLAGLLAVGSYVAGLFGLRLLRTAPESLRGYEHLRRPVPRRSLIARVRHAVGRRLGRLARDLMSPREARTLTHRLDAAGRPQGYSLTEVAQTKAADVATLTVLGAGAATVWLPLLPLLVVYGWFRVNLTLRTAAKARQAMIERDLPDFLDVLGVTVHSGMKFRVALRRVEEQFESPVSEEFRTALRQLDLGSSRREAFHALRDRNDSPSLNRFVGALLQAEELGSPLTDAMAAISKDMRKSFSQRVRRQAAETAPKVSFVATILLLPGAALLLIGGLVIGGDIDLSGMLGGQ